MTSPAVDTLSGPPATSRFGGWLAWSSLLVVAYLLISFLGWNRTLIDTEVWALYYAGRPLGEQLQAIRGDLVHPPLMYLIERVWLGTWGPTDNAAKALALVVNLPTFFLFAWLANRVTRHWRLASFCFLAVYLHLGTVPNQVRMYGLGLLLTVAAMALWEKWTEKPTNAKLAAWIVLMTVLVYTHLFGTLLVVAFVVVNWLYGPRRWAFTFAAAIAGFAMMPWFLYVIPVYFARGVSPNLTWVNQHPILSLAELVFGFVGGFVVPFRVRVALIAAAAALNLALFLLAWQGIRQLWPPRPDGDHTGRWFWTSAILAGLPILSLFLFSEVVTPAFHMRFVQGALPAYWLLIILLGQLAGRAGRAVLYGIVLPWVIASIIVPLVQFRPLSPARQAALFLAGEMQSNDLVLCDGLGLGNQFYWEWTHRLGRTARIEVLWAPAVVGRLAVPPRVDLESVDLSQANRVWFFYGEKERISPVLKSLTARGFIPARRYPAERPFLLLFTRQRQPAGDTQ